MRIGRIYYLAPRPSFLSMSFFILIHILIMMFLDVNYLYGGAFPKN